MPRSPMAIPRNIGVSSAITAAAKAHFARASQKQPEGGTNVDKIATFIGAIVMILAVIFLFAMLAAFPVKWLWDWLMPDLFNLKEISVWQAWGMIVLSGLLFKGSAANSK